MSHSCQTCERCIAIRNLCRRRLAAGNPPPTFREISADIGMRSTSDVFEHVREMRLAGYLEDAGPRTNRTMVPVDRPSHLTVDGLPVFEWSEAEWDARAAGN